MVHIDPAVLRRFKDDERREMIEYLDDSQNSSLRQILTNIHKFKRNSYVYSFDDDKEEDLPAPIEKGRCFDDSDENDFEYQQCIYEFTGRDV